MGFRHLEQAKVTKKVLRNAGIFFLVLTVVGIVICSLDTPFNSNLFLKWELFAIFMPILWIVLRFLNKLLYGEDGDTDADW